jgi:FkbM family methyltransferase
MFKRIFYSLYQNINLIFNRILVIKLDNYISRKSYSQANQDNIVLEILNNTFQLNSKFRIVDIGSNDPIKFNNTYLFESEFDSEVFSIDANPKFKKQYDDLRKSKFINSAIGEKITTLDFFVPLGSSISHSNDMFASTNIDDINHELRGEVEIIKVNCQPIINLVPAGKYDALFIDVEGSEYSVLKGIDFSKFEFKIIVIENNRGILKEFKIRNYLKSKGYKWHARIKGLDDFFILNGNL